MITVPHPITNGAFKKSFNGIYDVNASFCFNPIAGLIMGTSFKNGLFSIPSNKIAGLNSTKMQLNDAGIKLGYDYFISDIIFFTMAINAGENWTKFTGVSCTDPDRTSFTYTSGYIEPEMNVNFLIEESFAIGATVSYTIIAKPFDPDFICLNNFATYYSNDYKGSTGYFNFGFGFYYGLLRKKSAGPRTSMEDY